MTRRWQIFTLILVLIALGCVIFMPPALASGTLVGLIFIWALANLFVWTDSPQPSILFEEPAENWHPVPDETKRLEVTDASGAHWLVTIGLGEVNEPTSIDFFRWGRVWTTDVGAEGFVLRSATEAFDCGVLNGLLEVLEREGNREVLEFVRLMFDTLEEEPC